VCSSCASAGNATAPRPSSKLQIICQRARARARVMGSYNGCKMTLKIKPIRLAAQAQAPAAVRREDPSGRHLLGKGRAWKGAPVAPPWHLQDTRRAQEFLYADDQRHQLLM
jgi:hypothetical protein